MKKEEQQDEMEEEADELEVEERGWREKWGRGGGGG